MDIVCDIQKERKIFDQSLSVVANRDESSMAINHVIIAQKSIVEFFFSLLLWPRNSPNE